jgi:DNA-binding response OmpR family regulator
MVSRMNKKLHPIGVRIDNVWGRGYKIVVAKKEN